MSDLKFFDEFKTTDKEVLIELVNGLTLSKIVSEFPVLYPHEAFPDGLVIMITDDKLNVVGFAKFQDNRGYYDLVSLVKEELDITPVFFNISGAIGLMPIEDNVVGFKDHEELEDIVIEIMDRANNNNDDLEVESDIEVDIEIEEVPIDNDFEIVKKVNKNNSDYSVAGFKKLTESRDGYTPIEEAMEEAGFYEEEDKVNQPSHYTFSDKFEIIDVVEEITSQYPPHLAFAVGNAIKYIARSQHKNGKQDIEKSIWYLQRVLEKYDEE